MLHYNRAGEPVGIITNIQTYTIHDGPGIRTEIFFKGCTMHCRWCSNPETISPQRQLGVYPSKCMTKDKCSWCLRACPEKENSPIRFDENGVLAGIDRTDACRGCLKCADVCPGRAIKAWGEEKTVPQLMKVIEGDRPFYEKTGGGVTLNGGEVLVQWEFAAMLLKACKEAGINTCVETALHVPPEHVKAILDYTDLIITDIKHMDSATHKKLTGQGNELILSNIEMLGKLGKKIVIRTPVVHRINSSEDNIRRTGEFLRDKLGGRIVAYQLLPYRRMGTEKYDSLEIPYPFEKYKAPERPVWEEELLKLSHILKTEYGLPAVAGSSGKLDVNLG